MNSLISVLSGALSHGARADLLARNYVSAISPHDFRHTCAVVRLSEFVDSGMEMKVALQSLRSFFGWSLGSDMPNHYAEAFFEDRLKDVWRKKKKRPSDHPQADPEDRMAYGRSRIHPHQ